MKNILLVLCVSMLSLTACAKEESTAPVKVEVVKPAEVAKVPAKVEEVKPTEAPKTKKVCIKTTDAKTKKEVEKCKTVKIHKKHEGTTVPVKKK